MRTAGGALENRTRFFGGGIWVCAEKKTLLNTYHMSLSDVLHLDPMQDALNAAAVCALNRLAAVVAAEPPGSCAARLYDAIALGRDMVVALAHKALPPGVGKQYAARLRDLKRRLNVREMDRTRPFGAGRQVTSSHLWAGKLTLSQDDVWGAMRAVDFESPADRVVLAASYDKRAGTCRVAFKIRCDGGSVVQGEAKYSCRLQGPPGRRTLVCRRLSGSVAGEGLASMPAGLMRSCAQSAATWPRQMQERLRA